MLREYEKDLPVWYKVDWNGIEASFPNAKTVKTLVRAGILNCIYWYDVLRLHRAFLLHGALGQADSYSRRRCLDAARVCGSLVLSAHADKLPQILLSIHRMPVMRHLWSGIQYQSFR